MFCAFHCDIGHNIADCFNLNEATEALVRRGKLQKYQADELHGREEDDKPEKAYNEIANIAGRPYLGGDTRRAQKIYIREATSSPPIMMFSSEHRSNKMLKKETEEITFSEAYGKWVHFPYNDPIVVKATIGNYVIGRILIDNGSSDDILYGHTFGNMDLKIAPLTPSSTQLYSFT